MMLFLNDTAQTWVALFGSMVVQNTIFLLIIFLVLYLMRHYSARSRQVVATVGLIKLLVPPFLSLEILRGGQTQSLPAEVSTLLFPFSGESLVTEDLAGATKGGVPVVTAVFLAWLVVVIFRLGWAALHTYDLRMRVKEAYPVAAEQIPREVRKAGVEVWMSAGISMPLTMGLRPRRIFVPPAWSDWIPANRRAVLKHELAHIQHHDGAFRSLEILVQALYFFHPLVKLLIGRLNILREMACDDQSVADHPHSKLNYSRFLVGLAETALAYPVASESASTLMRQKSELMNRVSYQVKEGVMKSVTKKSMGLILMVLLLSALPLSLVHGQKEAPPPPPPPKKYQTVEVALGGGVFTVDGQDTSWQTLQADLKKAVGENKGTVVVAIKGTPDLPMGKLHYLQEEFRQLGIQKVVYTGETGKKLRMALPSDDQLKKMQEIGENQVVNLMIDRKGKSYLKGTEMPVEKAAAILAKMTQDNATLIVDLRTEKETPYSAMVTALGALKKAEIKRIHIADPGV